MLRTFALAIAISGLALVQGCATKTYGRQGQLTPYEQSSMSCRELQLEVAKTQGFIKQVEQESQFDGRDVLAFLGDFGIGNALEESAALKSAHVRIDDLLTSMRAKRCPL